MLVGAWWHNDDDARAAAAVSVPDADAAAAAAGDAATAAVAAAGVQADSVNWSVPGVREWLLGSSAAAAAGSSRGLADADVAVSREQGARGG